MDATTTIDGARVMNQKDWYETVDPNYLRTVPAIPQGKRHHPVNHGDALELFRNTLDTNHVPVINQTGMMSRDGLKYVYVADIYDDAGDYVLTNGFINFNDRSKSFTIMLGERVFVCSNECFSHQIDDLRRKHTGNVFSDLRSRMQDGIDRFLSFSENRTKEISRMKETPFGENQLGRMVLNFHRDGELSNTNVDRIIAEYDNPSYPEFKERTAWNFQNACTHVFKRITDPVRRLNMQKKMKTFIDMSVDIVEPTV